MRTRLLAVFALAASVVVTGQAVTASAGERAAAGGAVADYVVLYRAGSDGAAARAAIARAGGTVVSQNAKVGYFVAKSGSSSFASSVNASGVAGAARNRIVGVAPRVQRARAHDEERLTVERAARAGTGGTDVTTSGAVASADAPPSEPLAGLQWDMRQIGATPTGSYAELQGRPGVLVGVIDTGIDGKHPDIAPNFDAALSHNFVTDNPFIDGPCEFGGCVDPVDRDDNGHGTHVGSTIASPINGIGIAGVAPEVTLVNIRAGQDSGYFFLQPTLEAMTYAGDIGVDVINMSYYTDPWLFNCLNNPADSEAEQTEQRVIREATQRAINYARNRGVLPVSSEGNGAIDLGNPTVDDTSPDFPPGSEKHRVVNNSCITVPTETGGVVSVSSTGITKRKAYYSNYGTEQTDVAAPGGDYYDTPDNRGDVQALVLAAYPRNVAKANGDIDATGKPTNPFVVRSCARGICGLYQYLQGTSMASPHAVGVAALIVSRHGVVDSRHGGLKLAPSTTQSKLFGTALEHPCPQPRLFHYHRIRDDGTTADADHYCAGNIQKNGFYGYGIVNAYRAVTG